MEAKERLVKIYPVQCLVAQSVQGDRSSLLVDIFSSGGLNECCAMYVFYLWLH